MAEHKVTLKVDVVGGRVMDELYEIATHIQELCDLIPEWRQDEAIECSTKIMSKLRTFVEVRQVRSGDGQD